MQYGIVVAVIVFFLHFLSCYENMRQTFTFDLNFSHVWFIFVTELTVLWKMVMLIPSALAALSIVPFLKEGCTYSAKILFITK